MAAENLVSEEMALPLALEIKRGARGISEFGYAVREKVIPFLSLTENEIELKIEIKEIANRIKVPAYLAKWGAEVHRPQGGCRLGFAPATSECYLEMYKKIPVVRRRI